jgi:spermidine synthase
LAAPRAKRTGRLVERQPEALPPPLQAGTVIAVSLLSAAGLAWEIILTRLASATLSYHYAFVVVSLAVGGLGLGAALVCASSTRAPLRVAAWCAGAAGAVFLFAPVLLSPLVTSAGLGGLILLALPVFLAIGASLTAVFRSVPRRAPAIYSADLVGAGLGAIGGIVLLNVAGPFSTLFILAGVSAAAAWLLHGQGALDPEMGEETSHESGLLWRPQSLLALVALVLVASLGGFLTQARWGTFGIDYWQMVGAPPDKTIVPVLRDKSNHARIIDTRWNAFARTDVVSTADPTQRLIFTDGGAGTYMQRWNGRVQSQEALRSDLETVPFLLGPHRNVLIIGAGGGIDIVRALVAGAKHVTAVDWNGAAVAAVRSERRYNGNVLDLPSVRTAVDDARHFLARDTHRYDTILLNLVYTGAAQGTANALAENYLFTTEAFHVYLRHLTPSGRIGIVSHQALEGLRTFTTGVEALHQRGLAYPAAMQRATLLMTNNQTPEARPTLSVVQLAPFNARELTYLRSRGNGDLNLQPLYVPDYFQGSFGGLVQGTETLDQFLQGSDYNVGPTTDDRPFFYDLNLGLPVGLDLSIRYAILLLLGALALAVLFGWPRIRRDPLGAVWMLGLYMAASGTGFMCLEIPLIQQFILVLGEPALALAVVLATLLIGGSLGSLVTARLFDWRMPPVVAPLAVGVVGLGMRLILPAVQSSLLSMPSTAAIACSILLLLPIGFVLGMPFPLGLRLAAQVAPESIALFWTISAGFSMLGSVLAALVALQFGFSVVLLLGVGLYGLGAIALHLVAARAVSPLQEVRTSAPAALASGRT